MHGGPASGDVDGVGLRKAHAGGHRKVCRMVEGGVAVCSDCSGLPVQHHATQLVQNNELLRPFAALRQAMVSRSPGGGAGCNERTLLLLFQQQRSRMQDLHKGSWSRASTAALQLYFYGKRTYFAREASCSVDYSKPDAAGERRMFLGESPPGC